MTSFQHALEQDRTASLTVASSTLPRNSDNTGHSTHSEDALLQTVDILLRDPVGMLARIREGHDLAVVARGMILAISLGAGVMGVAMGLYRGGIQTLYAGVKFPLVLLLTTAVCAPALTALNSALARPACIRRDLALVLCSLARMSLVVAAEAPLVLLAIRWGGSYHSITLLVVLCCAVAAGVGLAFFIRGIQGTSANAKIATIFGFLAVFALVGTQMSWTLRPFLLRPRAPAALFLRNVEGSFADSVRTSLDSARGIYRESVMERGYRDVQEAPVSDDRAVRPSTEER